MDTSSPTNRSGDPLLAGLLAGIVVATLDLTSLDGRLYLVLTLAALHAATGLLVGIGMTVTRWWADRREWQGWRAALLHAAPVLFLLVPLAPRLFDGSFAATLPGAAAAPYAVPLVGWLLVALAVRIGCAWYGAGTPMRRATLSLVLLFAACAMEWANRTLYRSGYPELHAALVAAAIATAAVALRVTLAGDLSARVRAALAVAAVIAVAPAMVWGLDSPDDRRRVAGADARHLVGVLRGMLDFDDDGHASLLGGGDCDEGDARRHPGARDVAGNGIDEDCDGADALLAPARPTTARVIAEETPAVAALLERTRGMNVLLVSVDALRADVVDADLPRLRALVEQSIWFERAFAPAAGTDLSMATLLTGRVDPYQRLPRTLFEVLRDSGRTTHAILPGEVLRYAGETLLTRGLDGVDRVITDRLARDVGDRVTARLTTDKAVAFLDRTGDRPFVLWAHYFDVHEHRQLDVPRALLAAVADRGQGKVAHRYRALAANVDGEIGRLLDTLAARGLDQRTIVVFFSDHGESLGEDPRLPDNHGLVVYGALTRVPLAIRVPGVRPARDQEPVGLVDLAPTLAHLVGAPGQLASPDGVDLTAHLSGDVSRERRYQRPLVMNEQQQWAVVDWPWKLLVRPAENLTELYDLAADPGERNDVAAAQPERVRALRALYGSMPAVSLDRTAAGRQWRERQARPPIPAKKTAAR